MSRNMEAVPVDLRYFANPWGDAYCRYCGRKYHPRPTRHECNGTCDGDGLVPGAGAATQGDAV